MIYIGFERFEFFGGVFVAAIALFECFTVQAFEVVQGHFACGKMRDNKYVVRFFERNQSCKRPLRFGVFAFLELENEILGVFFVQRELAVALFGECVLDTAFPDVLIYVGCTERCLREDKKHGTENYGDVSHFAADFFDEQYGDDGVKINVERDGVDVFGVDAEFAYHVAYVDGHQDDKGDASGRDYFDEAFFKGLLGCKADRVHDGHEHEHVNHEANNKVRRCFSGYVPQCNKLENVSVKEECADGDDRDEQEADGARCELAQSRGLFIAFFDGGDFGEEKYGSDYACAEIEYVEIGEIAVKVGIEQLFETKDKTFNSAEQNGRDKYSDDSCLEALL